MKERLAMGLKRVTFFYPSVCCSLLACLPLFICCLIYSASYPHAIYREGETGCCGKEVFFVGHTHTYTNIWYRKTEYVKILLLFTPIGGRGKTEKRAIILKREFKGLQLST